MQTLVIGEIRAFVVYNYLLVNILITRVMKKILEQRPRVKRRILPGITKANYIILVPVAVKFKKLITVVTIRVF